MSGIIKRMYTSNWNIFDDHNKCTNTKLTTDIVDCSQNKNLHYKSTIKYK